MNNEQAHEQARNALFGNIVMSTPKEKAISESDSHDSHEQNQSHSVEKISTQISTLTNATQRNQSQNLRKVYSHILLDDCITAKPIQWLIQGYLRKKGTAMLFGASGSAKSFIATDMSMHVAFKKFSSWNGKPIKHGAVIYFAGEDTEGLKMRIRGWMTEHGVTPNEGEFVIIDEPFSLDDENPEYDIENTIANIKAICPNPVLVVFDTLNRYMRGNENQSNEVRVFLQCVDRIVAEFDCSGMIVHHTGVNPDAKDRARGSSAFKGAVGRGRCDQPVLRRQGPRASAQSGADHGRADGDHVRRADGARRGDDAADAASDGYARGRVKLFNSSSPECVCSSDHDFFTLCKII